jgi:hypothetical protein
MVETLPTVQPIAVAARVPAEAHKAILLTQVQDEPVGQGLCMYDTQQVEQQTPIQLAPAIHLYNIAEIVDCFDFETTLSNY